ncbi:MAG: immunoglobulin domain-containing protein [Verrucomicrobiae bacterium]|nr:immunoglobulin domain-containing protein [Verrucomicrobiae bacterium]
MKCLLLSLLGGIFLLTSALAQSNVNVRVMAANLNGNTQSYQPFALRILQGLKPDVVAIQEFNYSNNTPADFRFMLDTALGTNFVYYREPFNGSGNIPNGIISRWPIVSAGSWADAQQSQPNRGFAWAQIQLPGTNSLYVVSVHLLTSSASARSAEAAALKTLIQSNFPTNAWVVLAGDFNTDSRTESTTMTTCDSYLSDFPVPVDNLGNSFTSQNRNHPHDYVLPSFALTNFETATVLPSQAFPNGLVFDSTVYTPLSDVAPVQFADSTNAQHMAVMKDFSIPAGPATNPPAIAAQPSGQTNAVGTTISFSVTATGSGTLNYQWLFNGANLAGAASNPLVIPGAQLTNNGNYSVVVTNLFGSATSSIAVLLLTNAPPAIVTPPQGQSVLAGQGATFSVTASGTPLLNYQWLFNGTNLSGATTNPLVLVNVQPANSGNYSVIVSNFAGSVTSAPAALAIIFTNPVVFAQWNFNSVSPDSSTSTGSTVPSIGSGTASLVGGATASFAGGDAAYDPAGSTDNSGWNTATYPAQGTGNKTRGVQFAVSTAGKQNIVISWTSQSSSTGGKYGRLQYSTNGVDFVDFPAPFINGTTYTVKTNSLAGVSGVNNNANFAFRFVAEFESTAIGTGNANYVAAGTTYGTSGTMRYDMVTVSGTSFVVAGPAVLMSPAVGGGQFAFTVTGSVGANYVVQSSTNLSATNWVPLLTNTPPFPFGETNLSAPQKFYRAVAQ